VKTVRLIRHWSQPDWMRQTPGQRGLWGEIAFTEAPIDACDYVIIHGVVPEAVEVVCPPENVWSVIGEPPLNCFVPWHTEISNVARVFTVNEALQGERYVHGFTPLPWHVDRSYDELTTMRRPAKTRDLSWVTSDAATFPGHRARMRFLEGLRGRVDFDLFGRGFTPIRDKWDGLAGYRYSLAIENHRNPYYWTEKIADCFLAWTMPIYCGCTRISEYFPAEALVPIDLNATDVVDQVRDAAASDRWEKNLDAIAYARELVLERYQFFAFAADAIHRWEAAGKGTSPAQRMTLEYAAQTAATT
jgi:hypothetical protein